MNISSMTGFARRQDKATIGHKKYQWIWEFKSVNSKNREIKVRLPQWLDELDESVKGICYRLFSRGSFNVSLEIEVDNSKPEIVVNQDLLAVLIDTLKTVYDQTPELFDKASPAELFSIPEVVKISANQLSEDELKELKNQLNQSLYATGQALKDDRQKEGRKIGRFLTDITYKMEKIVERVRQIAKETPSRMREKIMSQIKQMFQDEKISDDRIAQEALFLIMRADVKEELDRLEAHLKTARELLEASEPVGRRLDFLCQELNREANTLCSKSMDLEQTKLGMELKADIEQFREQVQNVE